jgi:acyl CoA:acetate/3-ketoacid CoA transferase beta subunit
MDLVTAARQVIHNAAYCRRKIVNACTLPLDRPIDRVVSE